MQFELKGNIVDIRNRRIYEGELVIVKGIINSIKEINNIPSASLPFITPGFIDAHVHIESSMLVPSEFAKLAVVHGTVATVSDPHEIANVCGIEGVDFMISNGETVPFKFHFGAPSCVPATSFETAGAEINASDVADLMKRKDIYYLSEMMNYPGVINDDEEIVKKINAAVKNGKPIDGHAPGLTRNDLKKYAAAGITTDHECTTKNEALEKLGLGMKILIREGSAAKNFEALIELLNDFPNEIMFCSDDKHPDSLLEGHINLLCKRAVEKGIDIFKVLKAACINPVEHYNLKVGTLNIGDPADLIFLQDLEQFKVIKTFINGELVAENGVSLIKTEKSNVINHFEGGKKTVKDFELEYSGQKTITIIEAVNESLITNKLVVSPKISDSKIVSDPDNDILKMAVVNRYKEAKPSIGFVKHFGLVNCAIASSVAHDSHNIIVVGTNDDLMCSAVNKIIEVKGGISISFYKKDNSQVAETFILPLPIAGLMSNNDGKEIAEKYTQMDKIAKEMGSKLSAPFMTLSFLALLVIPHIKLSDLGLFDSDSFRLSN